MRVLVADGGRSAGRMKAILEPRNCRVELAETGEEALEFAKLYDFDIAILDMDLAQTDGDEVLKRMRASGNGTPVLVLSATNDRQARIRMLVAGADDVLVKPLDEEEFVARVQAIVRRSKGHATSVIRTGRMTIDISRRAVEIDGKPLSVSPKEYGILELLSLRRGRALTKEMFLDHLYGGMDEPEQKIIDVFICKLRRKITKLTDDFDAIETVWGHGYKLREPAGAAGGLAEDTDAFEGENGFRPSGAAAQRPAGLSELDLLLLQLFR
ncbi:MAG: response regulator transcription factor [Geminicoccaceae bacterium]|nr:response regulator transcription factor [Geminicoccaceae bacterium]